MNPLAFSVIVSLLTLSTAEWTNAAGVDLRQAADPAMTQIPEWGQAEAALAQHQDRLLSIPGVVGVGLGLSDDGRPAVHVYFNPGTGPNQSATIPQELGGVPVKVLETDDIRAR